MALDKGENGEYLRATHFGMPSIVEQRYQNGTEIHLGDVVSYNGQSGRIVFVADRQEYSDRYPESEWPSSRYPLGFMIEFTNGALLFLECPDEYLEFISKR